MGVFPDAKPERYGRYVLLDRINVGGMAEVFRGKMAGVEGFERLVALKRILPNIAADPDFVEMFVDEAKLAVQLQHANIAQVYELGKEDDTYFIAMEYVSGVDLRTMWDRARARNRLLPIAMSCHIMQRVCEGLDAAHRKKDGDGDPIGLVHRDVSPQNVLVSYEGEAKVIDFGIARAAKKVSKTQAGVLKGKFGYMSPEQVRGVTLDNRSDIFACGIVLYELLVGDRLFLGESDFSTLEKVRNVELVPPTRLNKSLSPHLERIVMKALAKNREDRYRWAGEMAEDLQRYLFATNQPFARTDLQRYMQQHFRKEIDKERARLDRYKNIRTADILKPEPTTDEHPEIPTEMHAGLQAGLQEQTQTQAEVREPAPGLAAQPISFQDAVAPPAPATGSVNTAGAPAAKPSLPTWAAAIIGALTVCLIGAVAFGAYWITKKPEAAVLEIRAVPSDVEIKVDGAVVAHKSPFVIDSLSPDTHVVEVEAAGFEKQMRAVAIGEGERRLETFKLKEKAGTATLIVESTPPGMNVFIDGKETGKKTPATFGQMSEGTVRISLRRPDGSLVHRAPVMLEKKGVRRIMASESQLPTLLDVTTIPAGALVKVDGVEKGSAPVTISGLSARTVRVNVRKVGCEDYDERVKLRRATITEASITLKCSDTKSMLDITANTVADVVVDGKPIGRTPQLGVSVTPGDHSVKLVPIQGDKPPFEVVVKVGEKKASVHHTF